MDQDSDQRKLQLSKYRLPQGFQFRASCSVSAM